MKVQITDKNDKRFQTAIQNNERLNEFDTSHVSNMSHMFEDATSFNQPLDHFDLCDVMNMQNMFYGAASMFIGYIMRFAAKAIYVYHKYQTMWNIRMNDFHFSNSMELDEYIKYMGEHISGKEKITSALVGFLID